MQVFNTDGEFLLKFGSNGEGNGQFNAPTGVAVDVNGNIIVADWGNSRIQVSMKCSHYRVCCYVTVLFKSQLLSFRIKWRQQVIGGKFMLIISHITAAHLLPDRITSLPN